MFDKGEIIMASDKTDKKVERKVDQSEKDLSSAIWQKCVYISHKAC